MFAEIAKPLALISCILSLYGLFYAAFLEPAVDWEQRVLRSLSLLLIAAGICVVSGLIFRETAPGRSANGVPLSSMLPVRMFYWASSVMLVLFLLSWYLQSHCIFYREVRF
jgi:hypothetical protein